MQSSVDDSISSLKKKNSVNICPSLLNDQLAEFPMHFDEPSIEKFVQAEEEFKEKASSKQEKVPRRDNFHINIENGTANIVSSQSLDSFDTSVKGLTSSGKSFNLTPEKIEDQRKNLFNSKHPISLLKKNEELKLLNNSFELESLKSEVKETTNGKLPFRGNNEYFLLPEEIATTDRKGFEEFQQSTVIKRGLLSRPVTISLPFDEYVDLVKGRESTVIASNYPSYKIDKRLIFLGKEVDLPWHIISYHSNFRKLWDIFIMTLIVYGTFWYPLAVVFIYHDPWPVGVLITEILSIFIYLIDIIINFRTTYSNENNEEIIDSTMMKDNYIKSKMFLIDIITFLPTPEIALIMLVGSSRQWFIYSLVILIRMLRVFKLMNYLQNRALSAITKLLKLFIAFFLIVHWTSCAWYAIIRAEFPLFPTVSNLWFPNNLRMVAASDEDLLAYYDTMSTFKIYGFTLLSVFMLVVGSDMAPITDVQIWSSILIGLFGAVGLAYIFATVTLTINRAYRESLEYETKLEDLKHKLKANGIPQNLKIKVMEYFYYSWRKHSVLKQMDDFSELSIPLQRDIALFRHQDMILKVPLFKDLDPVEILSIVSKLKTSIYMPGDKIIREGERGTEMFFIQEGSAEMLIRKSLMKGVQEGTSKPKYERVMLERGDYFGEVGLMSNSKRTYDVNAFEFSILFTFSKSDYDSLSYEFKDIGPRLRSGLKHYKNTHMTSLIQILKGLNIFEGFSDLQLQRIGDEYLEELFVDPDQVILAPKNRTNAIYIMMGGNVNCYPDNEETKDYLSHLKRSNERENYTVVDAEESQEIECLDDDILKLEKDRLSMEDDKKKLDLIEIYTYGEYFGTLDFDLNETRCKNYYVTDSGCRLGVITQSLKSQMEEEDPELFQKFKFNVLKYSSQRDLMGEIEEEIDNTLAKTKLNKRIPSLTDIAKKPILLKASSLNKDDDLYAVRDELRLLEDEMQNFKAFVNIINNKLNRATSNWNPASNPKDEYESPEKPKTADKALIQAQNEVKAFEKPTPSKELARMLLGIDEADQADETVIEKE